MRISENQIKRMVKLVFEELKTQDLVQFKAGEDQVRNRALAIVKADFAKEKQLDEEVHRMMDELERQHPEGFQRYKMFPLLKKKLAKEKGVIL